MVKLKILLVDDEAEVLRALERELEDFVEEKGMELQTYNSPFDALEEIKIKHEEIALIISDQKMPRMKGCDFLKKAKEIDSDLVSILLTAHTEISDIIETIKTGLFSFILKPWDNEQLIYEIEKALNLYHLQKDNKKYILRLQEELKWGGELQKKLLQQELPHNSQARFNVSYTPVPEFYCGGDYYDIIPFDDDHFMVLIGDVSGHGIKAAFITFILKTLMNEAVQKKTAKTYFRPSTLLSWLNNRICQELSNTESILVTFMACLVNMKKKNITISNAGHVPAKIIRKDVIYEVNLKGTALGFQKNLKYTDKTEPIEKGDRIILSTDGITEIDLKGKAMEQIYMKHRKESEFTQKVMDDINENTSHGSNRDDMTLISVEITS